VITVVRRLRLPRVVPATLIMLHWISGDRWGLAATPIS